MILYIGGCWIYEYFCFICVWMDTDATLESESASEKIVSALVSRFGCPVVESRLKSAIVMNACMQRGHPSFRMQVRSRADVMQKFFGM